MFVFVKAVQAQDIRHAFGLCDGATRSENRNDGTADLDVAGSPKGLQGKLWQVGAKADLALPVRHDRALVGFLGLGGKMGLSNPANAKAQAVSTRQLLEIISQHRGFGWNMPVFVGRLGDGEEDIMLHAHSPFAPHRHGS